MISVDIFGDFYKGKRVLVTGHTGFKGSWLTIWLRELGADVIGIAMEPITEKDNFILCDLDKKMGEKDIRADIRNRENLKELFTKWQPEIVFHLAAQPLVRLSYVEPVETYETNVMGTINVLEAIRATDSVKIGVMITTDKCYENKEQREGYKETDPLGGYDPYSSSKAAAEIAISSWRRSYFNPERYSEHGKSIASARAGNVIGGGDWSKDRIIPDCVKAIEAERKIEIRNPKAVRPWQHVLEPLYGYLLLAKKMWEQPNGYCEAWNFGPNPESIATVWEVAEQLKTQWETISNSKLKTDIKDISLLNAPHEANLLLLDNSKAKKYLNWFPKWDLVKTLKETTDWYIKYSTVDAYTLALNQIYEYTK